jgi:hypothetical protein
MLVSVVSRKRGQGARPRTSLSFAARQVTGRRGEVPLPFRPAEGDERHGGDDQDCDDGELR